MRTLRALVFILPMFFAACGDDSTSGNAASAGPKPYPLDTCIVSGEKLGSMGDAIVITHEGQEIKFCCDSCQPKFEKDPAKYLAKLSGDTSGSAPVDHTGHNH